MLLLLQNFASSSSHEGLVSFMLLPLLQLARGPRLKAALCVLYSFPGTPFTWSRLDRDFVSFVSLPLLQLARGPRPSRALCF